MFLCKVCIYNKITSFTKEMFIYGEIDKIELPVRLCVYGGVRIFRGSGCFKLFQPTVCLETELCMENNECEEGVSEVGLFPRLTHPPLGNYNINIALCYSSILRQ